MNVMLVPCCIAECCVTCMLYRYAIANAIANATNALMYLCYTSILLYHTIATIDIAGVGDKP
jgi:hypothetical protein